MPYKKVHYNKKNHYKKSPLKIKSVIKTNLRKKCNKKIIIKNSVKKNYWSEWGCPGGAVYLSGSYSPVICSVVDPEWLIPDPAKNVYGSASGSGSYPYYLCLSIFDKYF